MKPTYISGKITGLNIEVAKELFIIAENDLKASGKQVINPMVVVPYIPEWTWEQYMAKDIEFLLHCGEIYMLENWKESRGARIEHAIAEQLGIKITYQVTQPITQ